MDVWKCQRVSINGFLNRYHDKPEKDSRKNEDSEGVFTFLLVLYFAAASITLQPSKAVAVPSMSLLLKTVMERMP